MDSTPAYEEATTGSDHKQQKQSPLFAPTMTGKPTSVKVDEGSSVDGANNRPAANNPFGGYYFNVAQKGKLILPTALWILIVIAGACFIGLFATFNKTLIALEKVEQNQHDLLKFVLRDQETPVTEPPVIVKLDDEHDKHKCQHRHHHHHESDTNKPEPLVSPPVVDLVVEDSMNDVGPMIGGPLSWFKLPDWTSLDPQPRPRPVEPLGGSSGLFQQFLPPRILDQLMGSSSDMGPVSGGIIIESGQQPGEADHGLGSISSIMKLVDRIFNSEQPKGISSDEKAVKENPFISANIDKLEINLNDNDNDEQLNKRKNKAYSNTREEEIVSLEKSVNDLVSKLIDGSETIDQRPQEPVFMRPVQKLGLPMEHTSHRPPLEGPFSPLANLLMPFNSIHPPMRHPQGVPEMQQLPDAIPSIVLAIGDLNGDDNNIAKPDAPPLSLGPQLIDLGSIKLDSRPDIHPTVKSPYEFNIEPDMLHPKNKLPLNEDPVMNAIAEEMANSVLNNMIPVHPMHPMQIPHLKPLPGSPDGPVESIETMPVIVPPKPADIEAPFPSFPKPLPPMLVKPDGDSKQKPENNMGDLFKMFFGLPPDSPLVVAPSMNPSAPMPADEREEVGQGLRSKQAENKTDDDKSESKTESTSSTPKPVTDESKPTPMVEIISKSTTATPTTAQPSVEPSSSASSTEEASDVGPFLESLFSNVFALPQFNKEQEPIKVEAQQSGGSKPEVIRSNSSDAEATICVANQCIKIASGPTSDKATVGKVASATPTVGSKPTSSNSTSTVSSSGSSQPLSVSKSTGSSVVYASSPGGASSSTGSSGSSKSPSSSSSSGGSSGSSSDSLKSPSGSGSSGSSSGGSSGSSKVGSAVSGGNSSSGSAKSSSGSSSPSSSSGGSSSSSNSSSKAASKDQPIGYVPIITPLGSSPPSAFAALVPTV